MLPRSTSFRPHPTQNTATRFCVSYRRRSRILLHLQHDFEVRAISRMRDDVAALGVRVFLPSSETVENCVDKMKSYSIWEKAGVRAPKTMLVSSPEDLREAFREYGPRIWVRATEGGGGNGALPTDDFEFARLWIDRFGGWGHFTASECLTDRTVTWLSIWNEGELIVAQTRRRHSWNFGESYALGRYRYYGCRRDLFRAGRRPSGAGSHRRRRFVAARRVRSRHDLR